MKGGRTEEKEMCGTTVTGMAVPILERKFSSSIPSYTSNHIHVRICSNLDQPKNSKSNPHPTRTWSEMSLEIEEEEEGSKLQTPDPEMVVVEKKERGRQDLGGGGQ